MLRELKRLLPSSNSITHTKKTPKKSLYKLRVDTVIPVKINFVCWCVIDHEQTTYKVFHKRGIGSGRCRLSALRTYSIKESQNLVGSMALNSVLAVFIQRLLYSKHIEKALICTKEDTLVSSSRSCEGSSPKSADRHSGPGISLLPCSNKKLLLDSRKLLLSLQHSIYIGAVSLLIHSHSQFPAVPPSLVA